MDAYSAGDLGVVPSRIFCTGEIDRGSLEVTFAKGAFLEDPTGLFNTNLDGGTRRAVDVGEDARLDKAAVEAPVRAAIILTASGR